MVSPGLPVRGAVPFGRPVTGGLALMARRVRRSPCVYRLAGTPAFGPKAISGEAAVELVDDDVRAPDVSVVVPVYNTMPYLTSA